MCIEDVVLVATVREDIRRDPFVEEDEIIHRIRAVQVDMLSDTAGDDFSPTRVKSGPCIKEDESEGHGSDEDLVRSSRFFL
jgi:hypothetical protein